MATMMDSWIKAAVFNINSNKGHGILGMFIDGNEILKIYKYTEDFKGYEKN